MHLVQHAAAPPRSAAHVQMCLSCHGMPTAQLAQYRMLFLHGAMLAAAFKCNHFLAFVWIEALHCLVRPVYMGHFG